MFLMNGTELTGQETGRLIAHQPRQPTFCGRNASEDGEDAPYLEKIFVRRADESI
jgi:hypothetical protein